MRVSEIQGKHLLMWNMWNARRTCVISEFLPFSRRWIDCRISNASLGLRKGILLLSSRFETIEEIYRELSAIKERKRKG